MEELVLASILKLCVGVFLMASYLVVLGRISGNQNQVMLSGILKNLKVSKEAKERKDSYYHHVSCIFI